MSAAPEASAPPPDLDEASDEAITACGGDLRETVKAMIVANHFLETEVDALRAKVSTGYARGRIASARDGKE